MKFIKKFNEATDLDTTKLNSLRSTVDASNFTPLTDKNKLTKIYSYIFIVLDNSVTIYGNEYKVLTMGSFGSGKVLGTIGYYENLDAAARDIPYNWDGQQFDDFEHLKSIMSSRRGTKYTPEGALVDVLQYNPINFQELDNLLMDYDLSIENIFAVLA